MTDRDKFFISVDIAKILCNPEFVCASNSNASRGQDAQSLRSGVAGEGAENLSGGSHYDDAEH